MRNFRALLPRGIECRFSRSEIRAGQNNGDSMLAGTVVKWNDPTKDDALDWTEYCCKGCFSRSLRSGADVRFCTNHGQDVASQMGRVKNGTLKLAESSRGLEFSVALPNTQAARDLYALVKRGDCSEMSFAFTVPKGGDYWSGQTRYLRDVDLHDVSAVVAGAYSNTSVGVKRDEDDEGDCPEEIQDLDGNCPGDPGYDPDNRGARLVQRYFPVGIPLELRANLKRQGIEVPCDNLLRRIRAAKLF